MNNTMHEYSEFKYSNWYAYWMRGINKQKKDQILVIWHIEQPQYGFVDYTMAKDNLEKNTIINHIPYAKDIPKNDLNELADIYSSFILDIDTNHIN